MDKSLILIQAKNAVMAHDFMTAARLYKELLKDDPSNVEYLKQLGSIYVQAQEDEKAIPYYEQIITFYPHYVDAMNSLGAIYRRLKRYDESIQILQRALEEDRQLPDVNYNLGFTYKEMGNYADAIEAFEMVIHAKPDDVLAYNHLGSIYLAQKNYEKSIASYRRGLQIDRNHPILNYNLARAYEQSGNETEAIRCYQLALKTRPGWKDCISDYSNLLLKCQKNKEASDLVNQAIKMHPNDGDLLYILGQVYLNEYDYKKAESTFKKADNLKGNDVKILSGLAKAMEKGEKPEQALETVLSALEIDPYNKDIRKQYVEVLLDTADYEKAFENVKQLYDAGGDKDLQVLDLYGQYYITQNEEENAKPYYDKIQKINHHYKDHIVNAAERFNQIGNYDKAESYAKEFVRQRPNLPDGYNMLGKISSEKGNLTEAKKYYSQSQNVAKPNHLADEKLSQIEKQISELSEQKTETPVLPEVEETPVVQNEVVENPVAEEKSEDEEFDYAVMGGNIPLQEGLVEKEGDFWGDEEKEPEDEAETEDKKSENLPQENNSAPASLENSGKSDNAENLKSLDGENSGNAAENKSGTENPENFAENGNSGLSENAENSDFADDGENPEGNKNATENQNAESEMKMPDDDGLSLNDLVNPDDDKFDFDDFTGKKSDDENFENPAENHENSVENATPEIPENANVTQNPLENSENLENPAVAQPAAEEIANPEVEAKQEPETKPEDDFDFADFGGQKTEEENQKNYQPYKNPADDYEKYKAQEDYAQSGYTNPDSEAMKAALKAQQMAEQLADEQFLLRKENENSIQDALEQLRKMNEQHLEELKMQNQELKNQLKEAQNSEPVLEEEPQPEISESEEIKNPEIEENEKSEETENPTEEITELEELHESEEIAPASDENLAENTENQDETAVEIKAEEITEDLPELEEVEKSDEEENPLETENIVFETVDSLAWELQDAVEKLKAEKQKLQEIKFVDVEELTAEMEDLSAGADAELCTEECSETAGEQGTEEFECRDTPSEESTEFADVEELTAEMEDLSAGAGAGLCTEECSETSGEPSAEEFEECRDASDTEDSEECRDTPSEETTEFADVEELATEMEDLTAGAGAELCTEECSETTDEPTAEEFEETGDAPATEDSEECRDTPSEESTEFADVEELTAEMEDLSAGAGAELCTEEFECRDTPSAEETLKKIQDSLVNQEVACENAEKIEMFKKLRDLCTFLPADDKNAQNAGHNLVLMDYIIAKMSGKPGLLETVQSLKDSGALGPQENATENFSDGTESEMVEKVLNKMKNLAKDLQDKTLSSALCECADSVLGRLKDYE